MASDWLKRYREEGIKGLRDKSKSGTPPEIPQEIVYKIKSKLSSSKQGWTTKQVNDIIIQESGIQYHQIYIYTLLWKWGFKQSTKKSTCEHRTHLRRKKNVLKKSKRNTG